MPSYIRLLTEKNTNVPIPPTGHTSIFSSSGTTHGEKQYTLYYKTPGGSTYPVGYQALLMSGGTFSGTVEFLSGATFGGLTADTGNFLSGMTSSTGIFSGISTGFITATTGVFTAITATDGITGGTGCVFSAVTVAGSGLTADTIYATTGVTVIGGLTATTSGTTFPPNQTVSFTTGATISACVETYICTAQTQSLVIAPSPTLTTSSTGTTGSYSFYKVNTTGGDFGTQLPDAADGELKYFAVVAGTNEFAIHGVNLNGTKLVLDAIGEGATLIYDSTTTKWTVLGTTGTLTV
jgi:hypothetical protein|tara:strand:- start:3419 stop:4300 length:882 start_codon:yes stop_codon:yes gene_type:complete